jgi:hypothetical protein
MTMDATIVAPVFEKSYAMFASILGTWLPFPSIFVATYFTGYMGHMEPHAQKKSGKSDTRQA